MLEHRHKFLIKQGDDLFSKRGTLVSFWQEIADNFYVERADFTVRRNMGDDFASHLDTSYPILVRRDLGDSFNAILRYSDWFDVGTERDIEDNDEAARGWLEAATKRQRRAMYDKDSLLTRATKQGDHDYAAFGQAVISSEIFQSPESGPHLLYRNWHLRDVVWGETVDGKPLPVHRKWKPTAADLNTAFPGRVHGDVEKALRDEPFREFEVRHIVVRASDYEGKWRTPFVSIFIDVENEHLIEERGSWTKIYTIPRWQLVSGSQYAYSPATVAGLPEGRLLQSMTYTLLSAGENAVEPPMIGVREALRSDMQLFSGGFTAIDAAYDERLGEVLRPLDTGTRNIPFGFEMMRDSRAMLAEAFYLNRLNLPAPTGDMTAYEVSQRIQEYIRAALPLFEPMEADYNASLCEDTFELLLRGGLFGSPFDMPESLRRQEIQFKFSSPIKEAAEREKGNLLRESISLTEAAAPLDPMAPAIIDAREALRDALHGIGAPARWLREEDEVDDIEVSAAQKKQADALLESVSQGAEIAEQIGNAGGAMRDGFTGGSV